MRADPVRHRHRLRMKRVVQISDTHLSRGKDHFAANWAPLRDWLHAQHEVYPARRVV